MLRLLAIALTILISSGCKDTAFGGVNPGAKAPQGATEPGRDRARREPAKQEDPSGNISSTRASENKTSPIQTIHSILANIGEAVTNSNPTNATDGANGGHGAGPSDNQTIVLAQPGPPPCSELHFVPATANPYLAGVPDGTQITYDLTSGGGPDPVDRSPKHNPVKATVVGDCFAPGKSVIFRVQGMITYDPRVAAINANGRATQIVSHQKAGLFGKSDISAPFCALVAVFLGDGDPSGSVAPGPLNFSSPLSRDYEALNPAVGQIFFIGTGLRSNGEFHRIVIPPGATRLYFGIMDKYQWNNNLGGVRVQMYGINP